jgi:hypothetical protein
VGLLSYGEEVEGIQVPEAMPGVELGKYCVMPVRLVNRTKEVVAFAACDSHL